MALSKESEQFLSNLRVYLMTSGKKEEEILRVIEKVEHQLLEAEQEGKSIQSIIGNSPEVYMKAIGKEMKTDMKGTVFVCLSIIAGAFSIAIFPDIVRGELAFSSFRLVGMISVFLLFVAIFVLIVKNLSKQNAPDIKAIAYIFITICLLSVLFVSVFWLDDHIKTPIWTIEAPFVYIIGIVITAILIGLSWWTKTWIMLMVVVIVTIPELLQNIFLFSDEINLYMTLALFISFQIGIVFIMRQSNKKTS